MALRKLLNDSTVGKALLAFVDDIVLWIVANIVFSVSAVPFLIALSLGQYSLAAIYSFPALFCLAGIIHAASVTSCRQTPTYRMLIPSDLKLVLAAWIGIVGAVFLLEAMAGTVLQMIAAALLMSCLLLLPFAIYSASVWSTKLSDTWRNAAVMAVHYPIYAIGYLVLAAMCLALIVITRGSFSILVTSIWALIVVFATDEIAPHFDAR